MRRWSEIRRLFEAVCELPRERWRERLAELSDDQGAVEEALLLLGAQTQALSRVRNRLDTAIAHAMAPEFDVGQRLGPWRLVERIAHGGMGTVFRAERADGAYQRTVAIKLLHGLPGPAESARLAFERQVLAGLQLPNVAQLYDGGSTPEGHPYLVMEYVSGLALDRWCEQRKPNLRQRLALFVEICRTVQGAHQQLVLHCDLKPGNVLIRDDGHPVLLDFGVARMLNESHDRRLSGYCTPAYASPELMRGEAVGVASDVYSLGVMLVELLSGAPCHHHIDAEEVAVPLPSHNAAAGLKWRGELAGDLDAIAAKACSAQAAQRYRSVGALIADIRRYLGREPVGARGGGRYYRARLALRRNWQSWVAGVAVLVLVGVFVSNLLQARRQAEEEAAVARQVSSFLIGAFETTDPRRRDNPGEGELTARQLLDNAAIKVSTDLADAPTQLARMRSVLGLAYQNLGLPQRAEQLLRDAVDGLLDGRVNRGADAALALAELSMQKTRNGDGGQGLQLAEQALELLKRDPSAPLSARLQHARGFALVNLQRYPDGEQALKTALELYTALPAFEAQEGLHNVRYDLALMYWRWGRLQPAEQQFRALLGELGDRDAGIRHSVQTRLAQVLREQGRYAEALPLLQQELAYASRLYGEDSSFVLLQHEALADLYQDQGDYLAAELQYQAVTGLAGRLYGEQSLQQSMALYNHACLRNLRGDVASAERLFRQALAIRRARLGTEAAMSLRAEVGLGLLLFDQARLDEAGILLKHADAGLAAMLPEDAPGRIEARLAWLRWQIQHGDLDTARELLQAMELSGAVLPLRIQFFATQAALFERSGQAGAALGARRSAAQLARSLYGPENPNAALVAVGLGESLLRLGHPGLALAELRAAVPILRRHLSSDSAQLRKAEGLLLLARTGAHRRG